MEREKKTSVKYHFRAKNGKPLEIPLQGSLGLLAYGDLGLIAWREAKVAYFQTIQKGQTPQQQADKDKHHESR